MREKINNPYQDKDGCWERQCFERGAKAMLDAITAEIEKVENPYDSDGVDLYCGWMGVEAFEQCRQAILKLFKGENETSTKETR